MRIRNLSFGLAFLVFSVVMSGCGSGGSSPTPAPGDTSTTAPTPAPSAGDAALAALTGSINIDGSSTVEPITSAAADAFKKVAPNVQISVGQKGTGAGIKAFIAKEIEVCDASRPITLKELAAAKANGVDTVEIPVAYDGLTVVVNKKNTFATSMTTEELRKLWDEKSTIKSWNEINPAWPNQPIHLFGPTPVHGSFEFFTTVIVKTPKKCRKDYQQCTDYSGVAQGVGQDENGLGYLGLGYYTQNTDTLNPVSVDSGKGPVLPSKKTVLDGTYTPLTRILAIYVAKSALAEPQTKAFLKFVVGDTVKALIETPDVGYVDLPDSVYAAAQARIDNGTTGSVLATAKPGTKAEDLFH